MKFLLAILPVAIAGPVAANDIDKVSQTARNSFFQMPNVRVVDQITGMCGADEGVSSRAAYCTSANEILLIYRPGAAYALAHVLGHALQVRHGVADVALRTIRARRSEEVTLRGYVERQVDCIAGFLFWGQGSRPHR
jgi:hypothetical protein